MKITSKIVLFLLLLLLETSCSSGKSRKAPHELTTNSVTESAEQNSDLLLYQKGKRLYEKQMYSLSREQFEALPIRYPDSAYREAAALKAADSYFYSSEYLGASERYNAFLKSFPHSSSADYVIFQQALSEEMAHKGVGRDPSHIERAKGLYRQLLKKYPESVYAREAYNRFKDCAQQASEYKHTIAEFYEKKGSLDASESRKKEAEDILKKDLQFATSVKKSIEHAPPLGALGLPSGTQPLDTL